MLHPVTWIMNTWIMLPLPSQLLLAAWIFGMIAVPILKWVRGSGAERIGISVGVLLQVALVVSILLDSWGIARTVIAWLAVSGLGCLSEVIGSRYGFPYGAYHYTPVLRPQVLRVPVIIPLAWMMMMPPAWAAGQAASAAFGIAGTSFAVVLFAAAAFTSWDLYLDPQMVHWDFWRWKRHGAYFGIPVSNYVGWLAVSAGITALVGPTKLPIEPLLLVFLLTWVLQAVAQLAFWRLIGPGIIGFLGMGAFAAAAWIGIA